MLPANQANMFSVNITSSTTFPLFFYCGVPGHCRNAMVGVINPSTAQTLSAYQAQSRAATSVVVPPAVAGGQVLPNVVGSSPSPSVSSRPSTATAPGSSNTAVAPPPGSYSYSYSPGPAPTDASQPPSTGSGAGSSAGSGAGMQKSAPAGLAAGAFAALAFAWLMG